MEDFERIVIDDVTVEKVNLTRATYKEAGELKNILKDDIVRKTRKIVIDLGQCEFIDSTFIGVLVVSFKGNYQNQRRTSRSKSALNSAHDIRENTNSETFQRL